MRYRVWVVIRVIIRRIFFAVENLYSLYEVPKKFRSKLLISLLNERSKTLLAKLDRYKLNYYVVVNDYLLHEFKLTPQQYRHKYLSAQHVVWVSCVSLNFS